MILKIKTLFFICLFTACSSSGVKEVFTTEERLRQAAFYGERLQFLPALRTYREAIKLAEKGKDSVALSIAYIETGKIYRKQSLKRKALENGQKALSYIKNPAADSLRLELYREIGDVYTLSGQADSAFHYYEMAGCRIKQATILRQKGRDKEAETLLKAELEQAIAPKERVEVCLALADLQISLGKLVEAEKNLSRVPPSHSHLYAALSRIAQSRGDSLQADFYHKSYLHHLSELRQEKEQNQITRLLWTSEHKEWERRLSDTQKTHEGQVYVWITLFISCSTGIWEYSRYRQKKAVVSLSEADFRSSEIYLRFHSKEEWKPASKDWEELLQAFNRATGDTVAFRHTIGDTNLMPLEETSLKGWIYSGSMDGVLCYSDGIDTVWNVNAKNIVPAFLITTGYSAEEEKETRSSKTGNEAVDGKYSVFGFFETPRHYFVKCFEGSDQSQFYLYGLDKETGELKRETSPLNAQELFKNNWTLAAIGIRNTKDNGLPVWPYLSYPCKKQMVQFNTAVEIEYLKEKYPGLRGHPVLQQVTEDSNPLVTIYHMR